LSVVCGNELGEGDRICLSPFERSSTFFTISKITLDVFFYSLLVYLVLSTTRSEVGEFFSGVGIGVGA